MARTSATITDAEVAAYRQFCFKHHVISDGSQDDVDNANFIRDFFLRQWQHDINETTLEAALPKIRPFLKFHSPLQTKVFELVDGMMASERSVFNAWLERQRLVADGDSGLQNFVNVASWMCEKGWEITATSLDRALGNIVNSGHLGHPPLVWKKVEQKKEEREMSDAEIATWKSRAEGACARTPSGLVLRTKTEQIQQIVVNGPDGKTDWKATAQARELAASRGGKN